jgi:hypothetical protein
VPELTTTVLALTVAALAFDFSLTRGKQSQVAKARRLSLDDVFRSDRSYRVLMRFIGTDTALTIRQFNRKALEYQVQRRDDAASLEWAPEIYLELVDRPTSDDDA